MMRDELVDRLRSNQEGTCWWCGSIADSREHKHKKTLVKRRMSEEGLDLARPGERLYRFRGADSSAVKFKKVLCQTCNNARSQPFDRAYDTYVDYIDENAVALGRTRSLDWRTIYGSDWPIKARSLGCYFVKNFGCWMAEGGFKPPSVFASFLDGGDLLDTRVVIVRREVDSLVNRELRRAGLEHLDNGFGSGPESGWSNDEGTRLIAYEGSAYIRDIATQFNWADETGPGELFWHRPVSRLRLLPVSSAERAHVRLLRGNLRRGNAPDHLSV